MRINRLILTAVFLSAGLLASAESLSLETCRKAAREKAQTAKIDEITNQVHQQTENLIRRQYTPQIGFSGEAHYQTDAPDPTSLTDFPFELHKMDKFGYHAGFVLSQSIYRGGTLKLGKEINAIDKDIALLENRSDTYELENIVDDIYLDILLADRQSEVAAAQKEALNQKLKNAKNAFDQGSGYKSGILTIEAAMADVDATIAGYAARKRSAMSMLSELTGLGISESTVLELPQPGISRDFPAPAFKNLDLQSRKLSFQKQFETAKMRPSLNAFGTIGYGNWPLDFFKSKPDFYGIVGVSLTIPITSLQDAQLRGKILSDNAEKLQIKKDALERKQAVESLKYDGEIARIDALIASGEVTIGKYEELCKELEKMSASGVSSASEYVEALSKLSAARVSREVCAILKIRTQLQKNRNLLK